MTTSSLAVTTAVATTTTATTSGPGSPAVTGKKTLEPKVTVTRLSPDVVESAHVKPAAKADPNQSGRGKADSKDSSKEESMDFEISHDSSHQSTSQVRTSRSCSQSRNKERKGIEGKTSSAQAPSISKEPMKKSSHSGSTAASEMLLKAGGIKPPGKDAKPMPKYTPGKEYKVDYSREPCPPPVFQLDQPGGSHLEGAPEQPKSTWHADPNMSMATLQGHLKALAQAGSQHALYRSQQGLLRTRSEAIRVWDCSNEPVFVDEGHTGIVLALHAEAQRRNSALKADLKAARKSLDTARQNARDMLRTNEIQDQRVANLTSELEAAVDARDQAQAELEQLKASDRQLRIASGQEAAEATMVELNHQLDLAKQQLAKQGSAGSVRALTERCKELEASLQLSNQRLQETCDGSGLSQMQTRLDTMAQEREMALKREQELLAEGRKLEA